MEKNLFENLLSSAKQARDISKGKTEPSRKFVFRPEDIVQVRKELSMSQNDFANLLRVPTATLRNWEQGRTLPDAPAQTLLFIAHKRPQIFNEVLGEATIVYRNKRANEPSVRPRNISKQVMANTVGIRKAAKKRKAY